MKARRVGGKRAHKASSPATCAGCGGAIAVGDVIVWWGYGRTGARHLRCVPCVRGGP